VIERDAFTITWQARLSRPLIRHETLPPSCRDLVARFTAAGLDVKLIDITNDLGVASVMSIALSNSPTSPAVSVAAATDASPERAVIKAIEELAHTRKYAKQLMIYTPELPIDIENNHPLVRDQADHLRFYCPQANREFAEFAWSSDETRDLRDLPDLSGGTAERQIERIVRKCAAAALEPIAVELTSSDVAPLGLHAVRVTVPGAHPLQMGHVNRALGCRRLYEVPQRLGHRGLTMGEADNPYPHPFP
jgi:ribosomal protein S12 methylthiotransferase accessory factor